MRGRQASWAGGGKGAPKQAGPGERLGGHSRQGAGWRGVCAAQPLAALRSPQLQHEQRPPHLAHHNHLAAVSSARPAFQPASLPQRLPAPWQVLLGGGAALLHLAQAAARLAAEPAAQHLPQPLPQAGVLLAQRVQAVGKQAQALRGGAEVVGGAGGGGGGLCQAPPCGGRRRCLGQGVDEGSREALPVLGGGPAREGGCGEVSGSARRKQLKLPAFLLSLLGLAGERSGRPGRPRLQCRPATPAPQPHLSQAPWLAAVALSAARRCARRCAPACASCAVEPRECSAAAPIAPCSASVAARVCCSRVSFTGRPRAACGRV
jgi:hypothetical protein